jgi:hypothetical protein
LKNPLIQQAIEEYTVLFASNKTILFCWIPSHIGIRGNEKADAAAKLALTLQITDFKIPYSDFKMYIDNYISSSWQSDWDRCTSNKLHEIKPQVGNCLSSNRTIRKEEVVLCRTRIGHTYLTHSYLLKGEARPECAGCNCPLTVRHILLDCTTYNLQRQRRFSVASMKELFSRVSSETILTFLKEIDIYQHF